MRNFIKSILLITFCLGITQADVIWPTNIDDEAIGKTGILTESEAANALRILESMPWIEEGSQEEGKYMYVFYFPTLAKSKELYDKTRAYLDKVNIRWIPIHSDYSIAGLYETRIPELLNRAIVEDKVPKVKDQEYIDLVSRMTFTGFIYLRIAGAFSPQSQDYLPTIVYGDNNKLFVSIMPDNIEKLVNSIPKSIPNTTQPTILELAKKNIELLKVQEGMTYFNASNEMVPIFLYPDEKGVEIGRLSPDAPSPPFPVSGITNNGYIAIDLNNRGNYIYIKHIEK
ncbi:hypothetical protein [Wohlfahrtiimonas populi]|uniref:hypothetical protein n=1 Tax=Wohlfahrtiimonas populi TaxID=1940240 RepID=UPI00098D4249|nr:hypothetical protein [Wohlfahrtiimonas populi]